MHKHIILTGVLAILIAVIVSSCISSVTPQVISPSPAFSLKPTQTPLPPTASLASPQPTQAEIALPTPTPTPFTETTRIIDTSKIKLDTANVAYTARLSVIYATPQNTYCVMCISEGESGLDPAILIVNIDNLTNPFAVSYLPLDPLAPQVYVSDMRLFGTTLYTTTSIFTTGSETYRTVIFMTDISDPYNPKNIGELPITITQIEEFGHYAYGISEDESSVSILDVADLDNIKLVGKINGLPTSTVDNPDHIFKIEVSGSLLFVLTGNGIASSSLEIDYKYYGMYIYDIWLPKEPKELSYFPNILPQAEVTIPIPYPLGQPIPTTYTNARFTDIRVSGKYAYLSWNHLYLALHSDTTGTMIVDIADPTQPKEVNTITLGQAILFVTDNNTGLCT